MFNFIQVVVSLVGIIGLIFLLFYLLRKVNRYTGGSQTNGRLKIIDRVAAGRDCSLLVVSVGGRLMLLGASSGKSSGNIEKLCDLDMSEEEYLAVDINDADMRASSQGFATFSDVLSNIIASGKRRFPKERGRDTVESDNQKGNEREGQ